MKYLFSLAALLAMATAEAGFLALPVTREQVEKTSEDTVSVKSIVGSVSGVLSNSIYQYFVSFDLGTPGQPQKASIDTGSSDLWVFGPNSNAPYSYDSNQSSTANYVNSGFDIEYVDKTTSTGEYYTDTITWDSTSINLQFAVTEQPYNNTYGVFGIASKNGEASEYGSYDNYPYALVDQGLINSVAYSLYLDDIDSSTGTLLFGAVDKSHYTGTLKTLPITSSSSFNVDFEVFGYKLNGVLDAGTSLTYLPDDIVSSIASSFNAVWDDNAGAYRASGSTSGYSLSYTFGGVDVTVPASELFLELNGSGNGEYLTILPYSDSQDYILLGDTFLRSAYVVYDLSNSQIAIAQANFHPGSPEYEVINSSIPGAV